MIDDYPIGRLHLDLYLKRAAVSFGASTFLAIAFVG